MPGQLFNGLTPTAPVIDPVATAARDNLVNQFNNILNQINTTSQDASFNGINLLSGDTLKLTFNETGKSTLDIVGVNFNAAGLGLATLAVGDFKDNESVNAIVGSLNAASSILRSQASSFGSNLSIVQIRQDFSKNLINVLTDRLVQPDAGRHQRGSGEQPGAVHPPVDRGVRAGAGQPVAAERAAAAAISPLTRKTIKAAGETPPPFVRDGHWLPSASLPEYRHIW